VGLVELAHVPRPHRSPTARHSRIHSNRGHQRPPGSSWAHPGGGADRPTPARPPAWHPRGRVRPIRRGSRPPYPERISKQRGGHARAFARDAQVSPAPVETLAARSGRKLGLRLSGDRAATILGVASDMPARGLALWCSRGDTRRAMSQGRVEAMRARRWPRSTAQMGIEELRDGDDGFLCEELIEAPPGFVIDAQSARVRAERWSGGSGACTVRSGHVGTARSCAWSSF
jgi:hypothetical protein